MYTTSRQRKPFGQSDCKIQLKMHHILENIIAHLSILSSVVATSFWLIDLILSDWKGFFLEEEEEKNPTGNMQWSILAIQQRGLPMTKCFPHGVKCRSIACWLQQVQKWQTRICRSYTTDDLIVMGLILHKREHKKHEIVQERNICYLDNIFKCQITRINTSISTLLLETVEFRNGFNI